MDNHPGWWILGCMPVFAFVLGRIWATLTAIHRQLLEIRYAPGRDR